MGSYWGIMFFLSSYNLWIGTGYLELFCYNTQTLTAKHYMHPSKHDADISNSKIRTIHKDKSGKIWIGTVSGLNLYNSEDDNFTAYIHDRDKPQSISNNEITCLFEDTKNRFWIEKKKGLDLMDRTNNTFNRFNNFDALSNNIISGIQEELKVNKRKQLKNLSSKNWSFYSFHFQLFFRNIKYYLSVMIILMKFRWIKLQSSNF